MDSRAFKFMQDMLKDHESRIESLLDMLDEKVDKNFVQAMISDKVAKDEIAELLPDMKLYEQKMDSMIEESMDDLWVKLEEKLMSWD